MVEISQDFLMGMIIDRDNQLWIWFATNKFIKTYLSYQ